MTREHGEARERSPRSTRSLARGRLPTTEPGLQLPQRHLEDVVSAVGGAGGVVRHWPVASRVGGARGVIGQHMAGNDAAGRGWPDCVGRKTRG